MAGIDIKNKILDSHMHVSGEKKKEEYSICRSTAGGHITGKWQNKDPRYAGNKIFAGYGMLLLLFILYFHSVSILENNVVFAQTSPTTSNLLNDRSPSFLEAYWTDNSESTSSSSSAPSNNNNNSIKKEVGPGEGASTLAIVLVNKGRSEITALTGYLTLPSSGFNSIEGENLVNSSNISVASHDSIVKPGETFTLYFTINVLNNAEVGAYSGLLKLVYSKVLEVGQISASMAVPFRITGKVILDAVSSTQNLVAGSPNDLRILMKNEGSADASGVIVTITSVTDGTATTTPTVSHNKNNNNNDESNGESIRNNSDSDNNVTASSSTDEAATTENGQEAGSEASIVSLQTTTFNVGNIPADGAAFITPTVYPSYSSGGTIQNLNLEISYNDAYGTKITTDKSIGIVISPNPPESVLSISPINVINTSNLGNASASSVNGEDNTDREEDTILLRAGRIEEVKFLVSNNGDTPLKDVVLSLDSSLDSVKILGDSRWTFSYMNALSKQELSTQVFAAENVIATPIEFTVDAEYISGGQSKADSLSIGAYVDGMIKIEAYDFALNDIGGTPNLVGNLLNQGNTIALFTTVEMINTGQANTLTSSSSTTVEQPTRPLVRNFPPQQYLGDLSENSPLPFSIPLNIDKDTPRGMYPISIRVTYTDNLRNMHELILNGTVNYTPKSTVSTTELGGILGSGELSFFIILVVIILAIISILAIIVIRKRKNEKRKSFNRNNEDVELFDDKPFSADNKKASGMKQ
jgi:hypothetical protein